MRGPQCAPIREGELKGECSSGDGLPLQKGTPQWPTGQGLRKSGRWCQRVDLRIVQKNEEGFRTRFASNARRLLRTYPRLGESTGEFMDVLEHNSVREHAHDRRAIVKSLKLPCSPSYLAVGVATGERSVPDPARHCVHFSLEMVAASQPGGNAVEE